MLRKTRIIRIVLISLFLHSIVYASQATFTAKVVGVSDGDTITVLKEKTRFKIRLHGIDAPESHQAFGNRAKQFSSDLVFGKTVQIRPLNTDRYGRTLAWVYVNGKTVNEEIVRAGYAWHYKRYSKDRNLAEAEIEAR
jgi:endonuclease YncB( thermonuclease family)